MTYQKLFYLKYKRGLSTYDLVRRFPSDVGQVSEVAMLDIPEETLKEIVAEKTTFERLMRLKKRYLKFLSDSTF